MLSNPSGIHAWAMPYNLLPSFLLPLNVARCAIETIEGAGQARPDGRNDRRM
jgi:hypothetical protein